MNSHRDRISFALFKETRMASEQPRTNIQILCALVVPSPSHSLQKRRSARTHGSVGINDLNQRDEAVLSTCGGIVVLVGLTSTKKHPLRHSAPQTLLPWGGHYFAPFSYSCHRIDLRSPNQNICTTHRLLRFFTEL